MARVHPFQTNFTAGELTPKLAGQVDFKKYNNGVETMENLTVFPQGGCQRRSGSKFVCEAKDSSSSVRLIPFEFNITQAYVLELGNNYIRFFGSDYKKSEKIISSGEIINSSHILAFKSLGVNKIIVKKKPIIMFYSTGNEISEKNNIPDWKVRNSNSHYIKSLSINLFFKVLDGGILRDKDDKLFKKLISNNYNSKCDIIITNGAVSAGKFDFVPRIIKEFKLSKYFKGVAIRPGKPIMFAKFKNKNQSFFGLPGNPISSAACFKFFVYPYLRSILNMKKEKSFKAKLKNNYTKKKDFTRFLKCKILIDNKGTLEVEVLKGQESFRIKSFTKANTWALFKSGKSTFKKGEIIECFNPLGVQ